MYRTAAEKTSDNRIRLTFFLIEARSEPLPNHTTI
jgi:hypothetical protein